MTETVTRTELSHTKELLGDPNWRIDNLYHIYDKYGKLIPFRLNESQRYVWDNLWYLNVILKDRQRGFSTFIAIYILDTCLFTSGIQAGIVDITLDDAKLKLDKIRTAYNCLPPEIKAVVPRTEDKKESIAWLNGSAVRVGTSHRGGTLQILHLSEMGKIAARFPDRAREIRTGALNTVKAGNVIFNESTAEGNVGEFFEDCQAAMAMAGKDLTKLDYKFHFFGWWMGSENRLSPDGVYISTDDEKYFAELEKKIKAELGQDVVLDGHQKAWYVKKALQQRDDMMREYPGTPSEAFAAATEGAYLLKTLNSMRSKGQLTRVPIDPQYPLNTGWDHGLSDDTTIWIHQRVKFEERLVGYITGSDDDVLYYWAELQRRYAGHPWGTHYLPHDFGARRAGTALDSSAPPRTLQQILVTAGMYNSQLVPRIEDKRTGIAEVRQWLPKALIDEGECSEGLKCLQNYRREWDDKLACWKDRPRHDWSSHGYDSLETLVRGLNAYGVVSTTIEDKERQGYRTSRRPAPDWRYH